MTLLPKSLTPALLILGLTTMLGILSPVRSETNQQTLSPIFGYDPAYGTLLGAAWFSYPSRKASPDQQRTSLNLIMRLGPHGAFSFSQERPDMLADWGLDYAVTADNFFLYDTSNDSTDILNTRDQLTLTGDVRLRRSLTDSATLSAGPHIETQWIENHRQTSSYLASGLSFDWRDDPINSRQGAYAKTEFRLQPKSFSTEHDETSWQIRNDLRGFVPITPTSTLALRTVGQFSQGPGLLSHIGGANLLRGYLGGQFQADRLAAAQIEYRFPVWRFIRGVTFYDGAHFRESERWLTRHSGGLGFRFGLPPDQTMSVRWDMAVNDQRQWQSFVSFNQVF